MGREISERFPGSCGLLKSARDLIKSNNGYGVCNVPTIQNKILGARYQFCHGCKMRCEIGFIFIIYINKRTCYGQGEITLSFVVFVVKKLMTMFHAHHLSKNQGYRMDIIKKDGFDFGFDPTACKNCNGNCCIGTPGYVWVNKEEVHRIARFLGLDIKDFISTHLRKINDRFSLKEVKRNSSFECVFFDDRKKRCSIYRVRPTQCRRFPFWDYFKNNVDAALKECPGVTV